MKRRFGLIAGFACASAALAVGAAFANPEEPPRLLAGSGLYFDRAVAVEGRRVPLARGSLELTRGFLVPAAPRGEAPLEVVFVGEGRFEFTPPNAIEAHQLEVFARKSVLSEDVERALLAFGDAGAVRALFEDGERTEIAKAARQEAASAFAQWVWQKGREAIGAAAPLFGATVGDGSRRDYIGIWLTTRELGDLYYSFDPAAEDAVQLGRIAVAEEPETDEEENDGTSGDSDGEEPRITKRLRPVEIWVSSPVDPDRPPAQEAVQPEHYEIDVRLAPDDEEISGTARLDLVARESGVRVVSLRLARGLNVESVTDDRTRRLAWRRNEGGFDVALAEPTQRDARSSIVVRYSGKAFRKVRRLIGSSSYHGVYTLRDTTGWYPSAGRIGRATYDVRLHWPADLQLLASGKVVEQGADEAGPWQRRRIEIPTLGFSFEVGEFYTLTDHVGHIDLTVAFSKFFGYPGAALKAEIRDFAKAAILFYETAFGWLDVDELTLVVVPRDFSQGLFGFLTLSGRYLFDREFVPANFLEENRQSPQERRLEVLAHEIAHQWWGNKVGWAGYRDQWLSEAIADFSAVQFMSRISTRSPVYLVGHARQWRRNLRRQHEDGRNYESLGPVVLGTRLLVSHSPAEYSAVIYDKGSMVFSTLAKMLGDEFALRALHAVANRVDYGVIDTAAFFDMLELLSGRSLADFAAGYVYGTGIPEFFYDYTIERPPEGGFAITGSVRRLSGVRYRYTLAPAETGHWTLARRPVGETAGAPASIVVPFQVALATSKPDEVAPGVGGTLVLDGPLTEFRIPLDEEPRELWLDQRGEVLGYFYDERRNPKTALRQRAERLAERGDYGAARETLKRALAAPVVAEGLAFEGLTEEDLRREAHLQDARIRLGLVRVGLESADLELAESEMAAVEQSLAAEPEFERAARVVLPSRIALARGEYGRSYDQLREYLRLDDRGLERFLAWVRDEWRSEDAEAFATFAVAAYETGRSDWARLALDEAEARGADLQALAGLLDARERR